MYPYELGVMHSKIKVHELFSDMAMVSPIYPTICMKIFVFDCNLLSGLEGKMS